ncbi:hypothetical protein [Afipia clevelandensis]|uniref:Uncharacterized protein n=1 Tax=Afipia clevelandensis ATCC 49720 TaxID=883079 RepID=K8NQL4_9BRAD|nr:hypothetical protein [Afipia clevelandensis]EKS32667.1 hypothetical protein HMPREF9696_03644 [Afipia clevelandensis ATCC 49720]
MFQNDQWAVTVHGLESRPPLPPYRILASELLSTRDDGDGRYYEWPVDIALKTWVEIDSFLEAFIQAVLAHHELLPEEYDTVLARTLAKARSQALGQPFVQRSPSSKGTFP